MNDVWEVTTLEQAAVMIWFALYKMHLLEEREAVLSKRISDISDHFTMSILELFYRLGSSLNVLECSEANK